MSRTVVLVLVLVGVFFVCTAQAGIMYTSQSRVIGVSASAGPTDSHTLSAPDFGPFVGTVNAESLYSEGADFASAGASGTVNSVLGPRRIRYTGSLSTGASANQGNSADAFASVTMTVEFTLDLAQPQWAYLAGAMRGRETSLASFLLTGPKFGPYDVEYGGFGNYDMDEVHEFLLPPGLHTYTLRFRAESSAVDGLVGSDRLSYGLTFTYVPEPSAAVLAGIGLIGLAVAGCLRRRS